MRLPRGPEVVLYPQVQLYGPRPEPAPAPGREHWRFADLRHAEDVDVVGAQQVLGAGRRGELHMVDGRDHQSAFRATAKIRRNGNGVPCGPAGYASRRAAR